MPIHGTRHRNKIVLGEIIRTKLAEGPSFLYRLVGSQRKLLVLISRNTCSKIDRPLIQAWIQHEKDR
jgi:hypothetical protein